MPDVGTSKRGAILTPAEYRRRCRLRPGDKVAFADHGGLLTMTPVPREPAARLSTGQCRVMNGGLRLRGSSPCQALR